MKILLSFFILSILFCSAATSFAQIDTNFVYTYETAERGNPYEVYNLSMVKYLSEKRSLPKEILRYNNCRRLNLSAPTKRIVKGKSYYGETKLKELPAWIGEMNSVTRIEICGNPEFNYEKELLKLVQMSSLRTLEFSPPEFPQELVEVLGQLKQIKELIIISAIKPTDPRIEKLMGLLPDCKIIVQR